MRVAHAADLEVGQPVRKCDFEQLPLDADDPAEEVVPEDEALDHPAHEVRQRVWVDEPCVQVVVGEGAVVRVGALLQRLVEVGVEEGECGTRVGLVEVEQDDEHHLVQHRHTERQPPQQRVRPYEGTRREHEEAEDDHEHRRHAAADPQRLHQALFVVDAEEGHVDHG